MTESHPAGLGAHSGISLERVDRFESGRFDEDAAEIIAHSASPATETRVPGRREDPELTATPDEDAAESAAETYDSRTRRRRSAAKLSKCTKIEKLAKLSKVD